MRRSRYNPVDKFIIFATCSKQSNCHVIISWHRFIHIKLFLNKHITHAFDWRRLNNEILIPSLTDYCYVTCISFKNNIINIFVL